MTVYLKLSLDVFESERRHRTAMFKPTSLPAFCDRSSGWRSNVEIASTAHSRTSLIDGAPSLVGDSSSNHTR
jgi:hypothetical protein